MDGDAELFQRPQQGLQPVGEGQGGGGVGEQEGAGDEHDDADHHKKGVDNAFAGDGEDPEGRQGLAGGVEDVEHGGEHQDKHHRLEPPQQGLRLDGGHLHHSRQGQEQNGVGDKPLAQKQGYDVADHGDQLGPWVQAVDGGVPWEVLAQGDVAQGHHRTPFSSEEACSIPNSAGGAETSISAGSFFLSP